MDEPPKYQIFIIIDSVNETVTFQSPLPLAIFNEIAENVDRVRQSRTTARMYNRKQHHCKPNAYHPMKPVLEFVSVTTPLNVPISTSPVIQYSPDVTSLPTLPLQPPTLVLSTRPLTTATPPSPKPQLLFTPPPQPITATLVVNRV